MPRIARKNIKTSFVHVMVQGVNKEFIFEEEKHLRMYLQLMLKNANDNDFEILAYCMMNNHAHFLFCIENFVSFGKYMHMNNQKFAQEYNKDKQRCGVVFRNRYQVEPIYDINHLRNCIKYIHNNPVKANMVMNCNEYRYSSYHDYTRKEGIACNKILKEIFGDKDDYNLFFETSYDRNFIDVYNDVGMESYINAGITEFIKKNNYSLNQIFSERNVLKEMVFFLKNECNLLYKDIRDYFEIPKGIMDCMVKSK